MATTQEDIARKCRVSRQAVSFALAGRTGVGEQTRRRIMKVAAELGYRPNAGAQAIRRGRFGNITMLLPRSGWGVWFPKPLVVGAMRELAQAHLNLQIAEIAPREAARQGSMPRVLRELSSDGLIILTAESFPHEVVDQIEIGHLPVVWGNHNGAWDCAYPDEQMGMSTLTEQVLARGHRRILFVERDSPSDEARDKAPQHFSGTARRAGYLRAMEAAGLPCATCRIPVDHSSYGAEASDRQRQEMIHRLLTGADRPTAIVSGHYQLAQHMLFAATELGLSVPRDLSLAAIQADQARPVGKVLTSLMVSWRAIGLTAARMLVQKIQSGGDALASIAVPFTVCDGQTLGSPGPGCGSKRL